jgi:lipid-A-disaccharide synthase
MRYYLIAGERSGDLHGSNLIKSLKKRDRDGEFRCWGGEYMQEAGADLVVHYNDLAFMGFFEVLLYFRKILRNLKHCRRDILEYNPDVVILIDFAGFNLKMASFLSKKNITTYYYISPKVWAWYTGRARKIKRIVDRMFVILPFEKQFYLSYDFEVDYVGNPVVDAVNQHKADRSFLDDPKIFNKEKYVALLPGSRKQELKSILPNLVDLASDFPETQFILGGIKSIPRELYSRVTDVPNIAIVFDRTYDVLAFAHAAVVTSGTATLETALWDIPQVVIYRSNSALSVIIAKKVIKVKFISLVNLIAGREVVRELIQENLTREHLNDEIYKLLSDTSYRDRIYTNYSEIRNILGNEPVSDKAADLMIKYLKREDA